jgi:hypothetical protein
MRAFDGLEFPDKPWLPCPTGVGSLGMCARYRDRFPTSLVWPEHTAVYYGLGQGGMVIRATDATAHVRCSYHQDGTTMSKHDGPCPILCTEPDAKLWRCAWPNGMLKTMMEHQVDDHNEVVLDAAAWVRGLPATIEAFFVAADTGDRDRVRQVAEDYRRQYGLSEEEVPIVMYDPALPRPFSKITL